MAATRRYNRVESAYWTDPTVSTWSDDTKLLAVYVQTCLRRTTEGLFRLPKQYVAADLGWNLERLAEPFGQLLRDGFLEYHEPTSTCLIVGALEIQAPDNPNQVKACVAAVLELPPSPLIPRFYALAERFSERLAEGLRGGLPERLLQPSGKPPAPTPAPSPTPSHPRTQANGNGGGDEVNFDINDLPRPGSRVA